MIRGFKRSLVASILILSGCGSTSPEGINLRQLIVGSLTEGQDAPAVRPDIATLRSALTPDVLARIAEPVILIQIPSRATVAVVARVARNNGVDTFLTPNGVSFSMKDGVIVGTRGLGFDLMTVDATNPAVADLNKSQPAVRIHRYLDGENQMIPTSFLCRFGEKAPQQVTETCRSTNVAFENVYQTDPDGKIIASRQWLSPEIGSISIEHFN